MLIDSHCHINFSAYKDDAQAVIGRALASDTWLINIGSEYSTSARTIKIAENYPEGVYAVVGLHPIHLVDDITESVVIDGKNVQDAVDAELRKVERIAQAVRDGSWKGSSGKSITSVVHIGIGGSVLGTQAAVQASDRG